MGGLIGTVTIEKDGLYPKTNAQRKFSLVNKTLKIIAEDYAPCELFIYRYNTGGTTCSILHINSFTKNSYCFLEDIGAYRDENGNIYIRGYEAPNSNFHIIIFPFLVTTKVAYEIIDGIVDVSSLVRLEKK